MRSLDYRRADALDLPLVIDSWVRAYRTSHAAGMIAMDDWLTVMRRQVKRALGRPGVEVYVACHPGDSERIADLYGWIAIERGFSVIVREREIHAGRSAWVSKAKESTDPLIHFVFVKAPYRRLGIARGLLRAAGVDPSEPLIFSCKTGIVSKLAHKLPRSTFNPLIVRFPPGRATDANERAQQEDDSL